MKLINPKRFESSSSSASTCFYYIYTLSKSLYIPLTSQSNTLTLPQTRGPNFTLPSAVVHALLNTRHVEENLKSIHSINNDNYDTTKYSSWEDGLIPIPYNDISIHSKNNNNNNITNNLKLPNPSLSTVNIPSSNNLYSLTKSQHEYINNHILSTEKTFTNQINNHGLFYPTPSDLLYEIDTFLTLEKSTHHHHTPTIDSIVYAGEGEPLLRFQDLCIMTHYLKKRYYPKTIPEIRLVTNGLLSFDSSLDCTYKNGNQIILRKLKDCGITQLSVALMTSDPIQYDYFMKPILQSISTTTSTTTNKESNAHERVCDFIKQGVEIGFHVEVTGVDYNQSTIMPIQNTKEKNVRDTSSSSSTSTSNDVKFLNKVAMEQFAVNQLGIQEPVRWRKYFP